MADPAANTYDATLGSPGTTWTYAGGCFNATSVPSKGNPFYVDAVREGRCQIFAVDGDANGYATFAGMATENDEANNRWGLFQAIDYAEITTTWTPGYVHASHVEDILLHSRLPRSKSGRPG